MNHFLVTVTAGTYTPVLARQISRLVELAEDSTGTAAGISVKFPEDGFTTAFGYPVAQQPVILGNKEAHHRGRGVILGLPAQTGGTARAADVYCQVTAIAGTTVIRVTEYD